MYKRQHKIVVGQGENKRKIPDTATRTEDIAKYIQVGDELDCTVKKTDGLKTVQFKEDDDDVEIQPEFFAEVATKVGGRDEKTHKVLETDEIGEIEGQLDNIFEGDDEIEIIGVKETSNERKKSIRSPKRCSSRSPKRRSSRSPKRRRSSRSRSRSRDRSRRHSRSRDRRRRSKSRSRDKEVCKTTESRGGGHMVKKDIKVTLTSKPPPRPKTPELPETHPAKVSYFGVSTVKVISPQSRHCYVSWKAPCLPLAI